MCLTRPQGKTSTLSRFTAALAHCSCAGGQLLCIYSVSLDRAQEVLKVGRVCGVALPNKNSRRGKGRQAVHLLDARGHPGFKIACAGSDPTGDHRGQPAAHSAQISLWQSQFGDRPAEKSRFVSRRCAKSRANSMRCVLEFVVTHARILGRHI